jgi:hypothetical protein
VCWLERESAYIRTLPLEYPYRLAFLSIKPKQEQGGRQVCFTTVEGNVLCYIKGMTKVGGLGVRGVERC